MTELNLLGKTIGRFEILDELGRGGMAVVYRARQTDLERVVAFKVLPPELSLDQSYIARFRQEARSAASLEHPHIVPIYEVGVADNYQYIAMKYIAGKTLKDDVQARGRLELAQTVTVLEQVAEALDYAHSQGIIHRDIKPSNIMLAQNGWVYLTDFGLARSSVASGLTMAGTVMGTPEYMSPEQAQGLPTIGPATDIYALGVVLYELLTGNMPFQADTPMAMLVARLQYTPKPPREYRGDLPMPVEDVVMRALARKPEARYPSAGEMVQALREAAQLGTRPQYIAQPVSPPKGTALPTAVAATQPAGPSGAAPTQKIESTFGLPSTGPTQAMPRTATPPPLPVAASVTTPALPVADAAPRKRRGPLIGIIVGVLLLLVIVGGGAAFFISRPDPRVAQGLQDGRAAFAQKGGMDRAIDAYKQVLAIDADNAEAHTQLAFLYNLRGSYVEAEDEARAALKAESDDAQAHAMLAESLASRSDYDAALESAEQAIDSESDSPWGYNVRATIRADQAVLSSDEELFKRAESDASKALDLAADDDDNLEKALAHRTRGYVYWQEYALKNSDEAIQSGIGEFNQAIGLQQHIAEFHSDLGYFYDAQNEHELAQKQFESALDIDPGYGHLHAGLGWNLYYLADYQGALNEFNEALKIAPQDVDALIGIGRVYQDRPDPDYAKAIDVLEQALKLTPKSVVVNSSLGWAYRNHATVQDYGSDDQKQSYDAAAKSFQQALDLNDKYYDALTGMGWVLQEQGSVLSDTTYYDKAVAQLQRSLKIREDQPYAQVALGWSYYGQAEYDKSVDAFQQAIDQEQNYGYAYYGLGRAFEVQNKLDEARDAYQRGADNGSTLAQDALAELK